MNLMTKEIGFAYSNKYLELLGNCSVNYTKFRILLQGHCQNILSGYGILIDLSFSVTKSEGVRAPWDTNK